VHPASGFGMGDSRHKTGAGIADSEAVGPEDLGFRHRYNGRVHPGTGYPAGLRRVCGRGTPCATTGPGRGASDRRAYSVGVNAVEAYRELQEQAAGMLAVLWHRSVLMENCHECGRQTRLEERLCNWRARQRQSDGRVDTAV
jgi:hypothetical protein